MMNILKKGSESNTQRIKLIGAITKLVFASFVGVSLLFFSIKTATANDTKKFDFPTALTKNDLASIQSSGRYMMQMQAEVGSENAMNWYVLVWDKQTGKSKFYYGNADDGMKAVNSRFNLPTPPL